MTSHVIDLVTVKRPAKPGFRTLAGFVTAMAGFGMVAVGLLDCMGPYDYGAEQAVGILELVAGVILARSGRQVIEHTV